MTLTDETRAKIREALDYVAERSSGSAVHVGKSDADYVVPFTDALTICARLVAEAVAARDRDWMKSREERYKDAEKRAEAAEAQVAQRLLERIIEYTCGCGDHLPMDWVVEARAAFARRKT
jgi:hypothetical protein